MGKQIEKKIYIVITLLAIITGFSFYANTGDAIPSKPSMGSFFKEIPGYRLVSHSEMGEEALDMLELDDHVFINFANQTSTANLYIGYYYSANKAYASHSPLICYPSQGWQIDSNPVRESIEVPPSTIHYEEITTSYDERKELVLYWYQARLYTNNEIYANKFDMGINKLTHNYTQHGFVRVAVAYNNKSYEETKKEALRFIRAFYPSFVKYLLS